MRTRELHNGLSAGLITLLVLASARELAARALRDRRQMEHQPEHRVDMSEKICGIKGESEPG